MGGTQYIKVEGTKPASLGLCGSEEEGGPGLRLQAAESRRPAFPALIRALLQVLARVFSRPALEQFVPRLQGALRREVRSWCAARGPVAVYQAAKALTFRMAVRILLGLRLDEARCSELAQTFEQLVENLFSLPLDVPFSGLRKVMPPQTLAAGSRGSPKPDWVPWTDGVSQRAMG